MIKIIDKKVVKNTTIIIIFSVIFHSIYELVPNSLTALFFPINESIWEHNKLIFLSFLIVAIKELFIKDDFNSKTFKLLNATIMCMIFTDTIFYVLFYVLEMKHSIVFTIILYVITIFISLTLGEKIEVKEDKKVDALSFFGFLLVGLCLAYFTYNPPKNPLFEVFDNKIYNIKVK